VLCTTFIERYGKGQTLLLTIGWCPTFVIIHTALNTVDRCQVLDITAGIIQGSGIGPASYRYVITAGDLKTINSCNYLFKYADDSYLITPSVNADSRTAELTNIEDWACSNNLKLNRSKSVDTPEEEEPCLPDANST